MKSCTYCGQTFKDHVDFCFYDGEVLVALAASGDGALDAPLPRAQAQQEVPTRSATPVPRARRGLVNKPKELPADPSDDPLPRAPKAQPGQSPADAKIAAAQTEGNVHEAETEDADAPESAPFVSEDDTIPLPTLVKADGATPQSGGSNDPTLPPAPDRSSTPVPLPTSGDDKIGGDGKTGGGDVGTPGAQPVESPETVRGEQRTSTFQEASSTPPSTYAAAPAQSEDEKEEGGALLMYGAIALGVVGLLAAVLSLGFIAMNLGDNGAGTTDGTAAVQPSNPPPMPQPAPPSVLPVPAPVPVVDGTPNGPAPEVVPAAAPVDPVPQPVAPAAPVAPAPAPVAPAPTSPPPALPAPVPAIAPAPPTPAPQAGTTDGVAEVTPQQPQMGTVEFAGTQPDVEVWVDGKKRGVAPMSVELTFGSHSYELKADKFLPAKGQVVVDAGEVALTLPKMKPDPDAADQDVVKQVFYGFVGLSISINGSQDVLPTMFELPPDTYQVRVQDADGVWHTENITITPAGKALDLRTIFVGLKDVTP